MQLSTGHRLQNGKYRIEKEIGHGGFGITYLARCYEKIQGAMGITSGYYMIVIKEFFWSRYCSRDANGYSVSISSTEGQMLMAQFKKKLQKEGEIISKLSHPNIVGILDIFEENNTAYLVMQYVEGESLGDIIRKKGKLDESVALQYIGQICSALTEIHNQRILHLDIKPSNILIDEENHVKIIDFGISKQYDETESETSNTPIGVSPGYSPIEQYGTLHSFLPPTDIYAAGATLYKMLTGQTPLTATARSESDIEPISNYNPNVSQQTVAAVTKAMSEKIRDRFQTVQDFLQALTYREIEVHGDKETYAASPPENIIEIDRCDTLIDKQPEQDKTPEPPAPQEIPLIIDDVPVPEPKSVSESKPESKFENAVGREIKQAIVSDTNPKFKTQSKPNQIYKPKKNTQPQTTSTSDAKWFNRRTIIVFAAVSIVVLAIIVFFFSNKDIGSKTPDNYINQMPDNVVLKDTPIEKPQTSLSTQAPTTRQPIQQTTQQTTQPINQRLVQQTNQSTAQLTSQSHTPSTTQPDAENEERKRLELEAVAKRALEAANLLSQANNTFNNSSLGLARYDQAFSLYKRSKDLGGNVTVGYNNYLSKAKSLVESGSGFDANVKKLLQYAQQLSNTQEVRDLLAKCN